MNNILWPPQICLGDNLEKVHNFIGTSHTWRKLCLSILKYVTLLLQGCNFNVLFWFVSENRMSNVIRTAKLITSSSPPIPY